MLRWKRFLYELKTKEKALELKKNFEVEKTFFLGFDWVKILDVVLPSFNKRPRTRYLMRNPFPEVVKFEMKTIFPVLLGKINPEGAARVTPSAMKKTSSLAEFLKTTEVYLQRDEKMYDLLCDDPQDVLRHIES